MKKGILLVNLGTPDELSFKAVFRYLIEFLTDERVIDIPLLKRELLVRGLIVPLRTNNSLKAYKQIWTKEGSPLKFYSEKMVTLLEEALPADYMVKLAMRYQNPSLKTALQELKNEGVDEIIILPLFPQYASATTGSIFQSAMEEISKWQIIPKLTFIDHFYSNPLFIKAFADNGRRFDIARYDHILFSFHGLPLRQLKKGHSKCLASKDCCQREENSCCYSNQCYKTAELIAKELHLDCTKYSVCFQSRLGKDPWLTPGTQEMIETLAKKGQKRVLVFCPSFVADCLETLYEIEIEYKELFHLNGGETLDLVPSLNDSPGWIEALREIVLT